MSEYRPVEPHVADEPGAERVDQVERAEAVDHSRPAQSEPVDPAEVTDVAESVEPVAQTDAHAHGEHVAPPPGAPTASAPGAATAAAPGAPTAAPAPETGDLVIDAALRDLAEAPEDDLDAQVERGEQVQRTLQGRLSDLGG